jgi:hypothetical protein
MSAIGHTHVRFKRTCVGPLASSGVNFCRKSAAYGARAPAATSVATIGSRRFAAAISAAVRPSRSVSKGDAFPSNNAVTASPCPANLWHHQWGNRSSWLVLKVRVRVRVRVRVTHTRMAILRRHARRTCDAISVLTGVRARRTYPTNRCRLVWRNGGHRSLCVGVTGVQMPESMHRGGAYIVYTVPAFVLLACRNGVVASVRCMANSNGCVSACVVVLLLQQCVFLVT